MKKVILVFVIGLLLVSSFTLIADWEVINKKDISIEWQIGKDGTKGRFTDVETKISFDKANLSSSSIKATVHVKSIDTDSKDRDAHLLNADFFEEQKFPTITFESNSVSASFEGFVACGKLTMKGVSKQVDVPFSFTEDENGKAFFKGEMKVSPYQFGVFSDKSEENEIVTINVVLPLKK